MQDELPQAQPSTSEKKRNKGRRPTGRPPGRPKKNSNLMPQDPDVEMQREATDPAQRNRQSVDEAPENVATVCPPPAQKAESQLLQRLLIAYDEPQKLFAAYLAGLEESVLECDLIPGEAGEENASGHEHEEVVNPFKDDAHGETMAASEGEQTQVDVQGRSGSETAEEKEDAAADAPMVEANPVIDSALDRFDDRASHSQGEASEEETEESDRGSLNSDDSLEISSDDEEDRSGEGMFQCSSCVCFYVTYTSPSALVQQ